METTPLVVVGAAGTGREVLDIIAACNADGARWEVVGVLDDRPAPENLERLAVRDVPYLGTIEDFRAAGSRSVHHFTLGVAFPHLRRLLAAKVEAGGLRPVTLVHPQAILGSQVVLGEGTTIYAGAQLSTNVRTGRHTIVNMNAAVGHDSSLGDFTAVNPAATISGEAHMADGVLLGGRATVLQGLTVGADAVVGAAALVTKDVPPGVVVKGVPGKW